MRLTPSGALKVKPQRALDLTHARVWLVRQSF